MGDEQAVQREGKEPEEARKPERVQKQPPAGGSLKPERVQYETPLAPAADDPEPGRTEPPDA